MKGLKGLASVIFLFGLTVFSPYAQAESKPGLVKPPTESQSTPNPSVGSDKKPTTELERAFQLSQEKDYRGAIQLFTKVIKTEPNNPYAYIGRGSTYLVLENYQQAKIDLDKSINLNSEIAYAHFFRGLSNLGLQDKENAISDLETAANIFQKNGETELEKETLDVIKQIRNT